MKNLRIYLKEENKLDLIKVYMKEVTKRLPEKMRKDIALELESTIYDMLPDNFTEAHVEEALATLGNPAVLASRYKDSPMHLIGPKFYDLYISLLKLIIPIVGIVVFITAFVNRLHHDVGTDHISLVAVSIFGETLWTVISATIQTFFWMTLIFAILERTIGNKVNEPVTLSGKKWTPKDLKQIPYVPAKREVKLYEAGFNLFWTALWVTIYFNAQYIIGIYEGGTTLTFVMPIFNQETLMAYIVIIIIHLILEAIKFVYMLIVRQWTIPLAFGNVVVHIVSIVIIILLFTDAQLFNVEFIEYLANKRNETIGQTEAMITNIKWIIGLIVTAICIIDSFINFRKATLK